MARAAAVDPLDEVRKDPRDAISVPAGFGTSLGLQGPRPPDEVAEGSGVFYARIYWVYGGSPQGSPSSEVDDPPCSGWSTCFLIDRDPRAPRVQLYHPTTMKSWFVSRGSYEMRSVQAHAEVFSRYRETLQASMRARWAEHKRRGWSDSDYATAELVMQTIGAAVPGESEWELLAPAAKPGPAGQKEAEPRPVAGKPPAPKAEGSAFKPVKRTGRKGEVLAYFVDGGRSSKEAEAKFGITRSNLLSQLFLLRKDHGIGYTASGDEVSVQLPEGVTDPFAS